VHIFDIRVFNPFASCYSRSPLSRSYTTNEQEKKHAYDERVREVEKAYGVFCQWCIGPSATTVYKKLVSMLADKIGVMNYIRCLF